MGHRHSAAAAGVLALGSVACGASRAVPTSTHDAGPLADAGDATVSVDAATEARADGPQSTATACTLARPTPPDWRLTTDGPRFVDGLGRVVTLRGVNAGGRSKLAPYVPFDFADGGFAPALDAYMKRAAGWGVDVMRVPFTWAALEPTRTSPPTYDAAWLARYVAILQAAWSYGIYTVVDFHQDVYAEVFCGDGFPGWTVPDAGSPRSDCPDWGLEYGSDPGVRGAFDAFWDGGTPTRPAYVAAWDAMIAAVADTPGVIGLEPLNEPASGTADLATFEATTLTAFYASIAAELNAKAPKALVFLDGTELDGVTQTTSMALPAGSHLVFAPHFYPVADGTAASVAAGLGQWAAVGTKWNVPVFVGEFGASNTAPTGPDYIRFVFDGLDALGLSGTEWEYSVSTTTWNSEMDSIVDGTGTEHPIAASIIRPYARAVAGTGVTQTFDATSGTFTLAYTATAGVTEVVAPPRAFPAGVGVAATGACVDAVSAPGSVLVKATAGASVTLTLSGAAAATVGG
jgi:endoglycosylceramidase